MCLALEMSRPGSNAFADADAKYRFRANQVVTKAKQKRITVIFRLTGTCDHGHKSKSLAFLFF